MFKTLQYLTPISALVAARLEAHGWKRETGSAIASKSYETDIGVKVVQVFLSDWGSQSRSFMLTGDIGRDGRKTFASTPTLIPKGATPEEVQSAASRFAVLTDAAVANTIAKCLA